MSPLGHIMTHLRLVLRMGQATGVDIAAAHKGGYLTQRDWSNMVQRCRGCNWASACPEWLDRCEDASNAPEICVNKAQFAVLKARQKGCK
nr:DUF6455 family protein [uncultured Ruegeria sp.]